MSRTLTPRKIPRIPKKTVCEVSDSEFAEVLATNYIRSGKDAVKNNLSPRDTAAGKTLIKKYFGDGLPSNGDLDRVDVAITKLLNGTSEYGEGFVVMVLKDLALGKPPYAIDLL